MSYVDAAAYLRALNWNTLEDRMDLMVWDRVNTNIWLPERIALSDDKPAWRSMTEEERSVTMKVFVGLTLLDTIQSEIGVTCLKQYIQTPHEGHVLNQFEYMESVHTRTYSSIFMTLASTALITQAFEWSWENEYLQKKGRLIEEAYKSGDELKVKIASVFLESFVFYSGFYWPLYWLSRGKLTQTGTAIKLIIRDEAVHGFYIGYKFRKLYETLDPEQQKAAKDYAYGLLMELYENEVSYTEMMYAAVDKVDEVITFLHWNANKALQNLGFEPLFPEEVCQVNAAILEALKEDSDITHDFFSVNGSSYFMPRYEDATDEDYAYSLDDPRLTLYA